MFKRLWSDDDGVVAPMAIMLMVVLVGFAALVLDVGTVYGTRRMLQNASDAAALAGARELEQQFVTGTIGNPAGQAQLWASKNGVTYSGEGPTCTPDGQPTITYNRPSTTRPNSWQVSTSRRVALTFGPVIGVSTMCVTANAVAVVTDAAANKVFPWAIYADAQLSPFASPGTSQSCDPNAVATNPFCFVLKEGAGGSTSGNFGILDFLCSGNSAKLTNYVYWAENGYGTRPGEVVPGPIPPKQWPVCTFTGNTASANATIDAWIAANLANPPQYCPKARIDPGYVPDFRCPLIGLLPVLKETSLGAGSSSTVTIVKFAVFEMVGLTQAQNGTGHQEIVGQFLQWAEAVGPTWPQDPNGILSGALTIRLVE